MELELVNCEEKYWEFVRLLRTNPLNQEGFFNPASITPKEQTKYMEKHQYNYKICLANGVPAGYVGFLKAREVTYCVLPDFHGRGIGSFMINSYCPRWGRVEARVKPNNIASQKVFEKLGFEKQILYIKSYQ